MGHSPAEPGEYPLPVSPGTLWVLGQGLAWHAPSSWLLGALPRDRGVSPEGGVSRVLLHWGQLLMEHRMGRAAELGGGLGCKSECGRGGDTGPAGPSPPQSGKKQQQCLSRGVSAPKQRGHTSGDERKSQ